MVAIAIRRIEAHDVDGIANIYAEVIDPNYVSFSELAEGKADGPGTLSPRARSIFLDQLRSQIDDRQCGYFVATAGDPVGFALASIHDTEAGHLECWLDDVCVKRHWQGQGIARRLVEAVFEWGNRAGAKYFLLETGTYNEHAHRLFRRLGFQPLAEVFWRSISPEQKKSQPD